MINVLAQDLRTILGRLGAWPSDITPEAGINLVAVAAQHIPEGGLAIDLTPSAGKGTVLLASAAYRNHARVVAIVPEGMHPAERMWLGRAMKLFRLQETVTLAQAVSEERPVADLIIVRNDELSARQAFTNLLKADGLLVGFNIGKLDSIAAEKGGNGWSVWRKPKTPELKLVPGYSRVVREAIPMPESISTDVPVRQSHELSPMEEMEADMKEQDEAEIVG